MKPHVNTPNIPRLLHFNLSINATYTDHNPQPTEHRRSMASYFVIHLFFLIIIPFSKEQQQVYYVLKPTYVLTLCVEHGFFLYLFSKLFFCFFERKNKRLWRLVNFFASPQLIFDVQLLPHKIMTSHQ